MFCDLHAQTTRTTIDVCIQQWEFEYSVLGLCRTQAQCKFQWEVVFGSFEGFFVAIVAL